LKHHPSYIPSPVTLQVLGYFSIILNFNDDSDLCS
jgi:hypothetical protein